MDLLPSPIGENELCIVSSSSSSISVVPSPCTYGMWTFYFDGSKIQEIYGVGCILIDLLQRNIFISIFLESECMNNIAEYEALILGLKRAIDLNAAILKAQGDSEIVVW